MAETNQFLNYEGLKHYDEQVKAYADNVLPLERGSGTDSVQQSNATMTLGNNSFAAGSSTVAGQKGYYIHEINRNSGDERDAIYLRLTQRMPTLRVDDSPTYPTDEELVPDCGFAAGDVISVVNSSKYERCAIITDVTIVDGMAWLQLDRELPFDNIVNVGSSLKADDYSIFCDAKPDVGAVVLKHNQFAEGDRNTATGDGAHAEGRRTNAYGNYSHTEGSDTQAGHVAHAEGSETYAKGYYSHTEGGNTYTEGSCAHAEGSLTKAKGERSHAEGQTTSAYGGYSHAEGEKGATYGVGSHVEGLSSNAVGDYTNFKDIATNTNTMNNSWSSAKFSLARAKGSHVEGRDNLAYGDYSHAEGQNTRARAERAHAEGYNTLAYAANSHTEGESTQANGNDSHAEGKSSIAQGNNSHAEGEATLAQGVGAHAEGIKPMAIGNGSHAEGRSDTALTSIPASATEAENNWETAKNAGSNKFSMAYSNGSHVEGNNNLATGNYAHAEGDQTKSTAFATHSEGASTAATAPYAHSEGAKTIAHGYYSHAEGEGTTVWPNNINTSPENANAGHAEGIKTIAAAPGAHAEGRSTTQMRDLENFQEVLDTTNNILTAWETNKFLLARATASHAEGLDNLAYGVASHAEGQETRARGEGSHAEGYQTWAYAPYSHAGGIGTLTSSNAETAIGKYNAEVDNGLFVVGNGTSDTGRSNAFAVDSSGNIVVNGSPRVLVELSEEQKTIQSTLDVIGRRNILLGSPVVIGSARNASLDPTEISFTQNNIVAGQGLKVCGNNNLIIGNGTADRYIGSGQYETPALYNSIAAGRYPEIVTSSGIFFGDGTDWENGHNLFAVYNDGTRKLQIGDVILSEAQLKKLIDFIDAVELS